jgi:predicted membrane protein
MHILTGGMILIALGVLIILNNTNIFAFSRSWPVLLIVIAAGTLLQRFKDIGGWIIMAVGLLFLFMDGLNMRLDVMWKYFLHVLLIIIGANILMKSHKK